MEIDKVDVVEESDPIQEEATITVTEADNTQSSATAAIAKSGDKPDEKMKVEAKALDGDTLYPIFWSLQDYFSKPTKLFIPENLQSFKDGLEATLEKFKEVNKDSDARGAAKATEELKQGTKRKWQSDGDTVTSTFNPKYLTSRDLFELEVNTQIPLPLP